MKNEFQKALEAELKRLNQITKADTVYRNALMKLERTPSRATEIEHLQARIRIINMARVSVRQAIAIYKKNM